MGKKKGGKKSGRRGSGTGNDKDPISSTADDGGDAEDTTTVTDDKPAGAPEEEEEKVAATAVTGQEAAPPVQSSSNSNKTEAPAEEAPPAPVAAATGPRLPPGLAENYGLLTDEEKQLASLLVESGQEHLFASWSAPGNTEEDGKKHSFFAQVKKLHESYPAPGGLAAYISRAKHLLLDSKEGKNPLEGWTPSVPLGEVLDPASPRYSELEALGQQELGQTAFVLVAGGLGERLGFSGIKVALPTELCTGTPYLEYYLKYFLALQDRFKGTAVPLAIMVSDDTHDRTLALLEHHDYFGFPRSQLTLMKQEKVASLLDNDARIALTPEDPYQIDCKPHGHGDVHSLLYSTGTAAKWASSGKRWVVFFQDTNGLAFHTLAAALGVSRTLDLEVNSLAIPRVAKQAIGAITKLKHEDGRVQIVNVEYNQLDPLLRAAVNPDGDVPDASGFSPYPGNINQLIFRLEPYVANLAKSHGIMGEFVNPKYADDAKTVFKKPTRLECMMQDYPKILPETAKVGFSSAPAWIAFSPVKNNVADAAKAAKGGTPPGSASSGEADQYFAAAEQLRIVGAKVDKAPAKDYLGISVSLGPRVVLAPSFAVSLSELRQRLPSPAKVSISANSTLIIEGDVVVESLELDGTLAIRAPPGTQVVVRDVVVKNKGWSFQPVKADHPDEVLRMRGYHLVKGEQATVTAPAKAGTLVLLPDLSLLPPSQIPVQEPPKKEAAVAPPTAVPQAAPAPQPPKQPEAAPQPPKQPDAAAPQPQKNATAAAPQPPAYEIVEDDDHVQETCMTRALECLLGRSSRRPDHSHAAR